MSEIKPIETLYKGFRFRSRLEARWAVLFDALGVKYAYETEGFKLSDGTCYLPDFYLIDAKQFFEVKGVMSEDDKHKIHMFVKESKYPISVGYEDFTFRSCSVFPDGYSLASKRESILMKCNKCGTYFFLGTEGGWSCTSCDYYDGDNTAQWISTGELDTDEVWCYEKYEKTKFKKAVDRAKQAIFEHGERG